MSPYLSTILFSGTMSKLTLLILIGITLSVGCIGHEVLFEGGGETSKKDTIYVNINLEKFH